MSEDNIDATALTSMKLFLRRGETVSRILFLIPDGFGSVSPCHVSILPILLLNMFLKEKKQKLKQTKGMVYVDHLPSSLLRPVGSMVGSDFVHCIS
ncbi:hypothetical protein Y1Q_0000731 [Alligator mississippiensis]|uniref:Uncharacterized protein n=1 Tax=Alligator mississippiensis TaxID=8496 RepID=A0A151MCC3_ALLMI|nr:hypothetical protein Y1Q_0000731 [Alligator mississippiensis]